MPDVCIFQSQFARPFASFTIHLQNFSENSPLVAFTFTHPIREGFAQVYTGYQFEISIFFLRVVARWHTNLKVIGSNSPLYQNLLPRVKGTSLRFQAK